MLQLIQIIVAPVGPRYDNNHNNKERDLILTSDLASFVIIINSINIIIIILLLFTCVDFIILHI